MNGYTVALNSEADKVRAARLIHRAPLGHVAYVGEPRRTVEQNDKMHAMLTDIARQKWAECGYDKDDWKLIFLRALKKEQPRYLKDLDGEIFPVGYRSSTLSKRLMADLITIIQAWGDQNGIVWSEPAKQAA